MCFTFHFDNISLGGFDFAIGCTYLNCSQTLIEPFDCMYDVIREVMADVLILVFNVSIGALVKQSVISF